MLYCIGLTIIFSSIQVNGQLLTHILAPLASYVKQVPHFEIPTPTTVGSEIPAVTENFLGGLLKPQTNDINDDGSTKPPFSLENLFNAQSKIPAKYEKLFYIATTPELDSRALDKLQTTTTVSAGAELKILDPEPNADGPAFKVDTDSMPRLASVSPQIQPLVDPMQKQKVPERPQFSFSQDNQQNRVPVNAQSIDQTPVIVPQSINPAPVIVPQSIDQTPVIVPQSINPAPVIVPQSIDQTPVIVPQSINPAPVIAQQSTDSADQQNRTPQSIPDHSQIDNDIQGSTSIPDVPEETAITNEPSPWIISVPKKNAVLQPTIVDPNPTASFGHAPRANTNFGQNARVLDNRGDQVKAARRLQFAQENRPQQNLFSGNPPSPQQLQQGQRSASQRVAVRQ